MEIDLGTLSEQVHPMTNGFPRHIFEVGHIEILASKTALLNNVCINHCSALLYLENMYVYPPW